jgi:signal transduction histidine kinase
LGWYTVAAVDALAVADALADPDHPHQPERIQTELWGLDHRSIARRLAMRWRLPVWMSDTISSLSLPLHVANKLVSHPKLFAIVQLALVLAQERSLQLGLTHGADHDQLREAVQVDDATLERLTTAPTDRQPTRSRSQYPRDPLSVPLLPSLLRLAGQSRRRNGAALILELENRIDRLYEAVGEIGIEQDNQLRDAKLAGLAELAAGAGHEINNPLAVISGNAQRLLRSEQDPQRRESLNAIIRQSNRIAGLLRELMEFARPPRPVPHLFSISELFRSVEQELAPFASERQVQIRFQLAGQREWVHADYKQVTRSLVAVVRNAIEATPAQGVVRVTMTNAETGDVVIAVEDTGPGLATDVALHAFDPFYCGRRAGRGRGLGLPTAWRLLQQNGGSIQYLPTAEACTRFVLKLKAAASEHFNGRQSA